MRLALAALFTVVVLVLAAAAPAQDYGTPAPPARPPQTSLPDVEDEVMCPVCGTLLELASESPQANDERNFIRDLIAQGYTKQQVKDALVSEYGEEVLAVPDDEGFDLAAWVIPGLAVVIGAIAIFVGLRRWRAETPDVPPATPAPSDADSERLETDLERYGP